MDKLTKMTPPKVRKEVLRNRFTQGQLMKSSFFIVIGSLMFLFSSCHQDEVPTKMENEPIKSTDTLVKETIVEDLIGQQFNLDSRLNPFIIQKDSIQLKSCESSNDRSEIFRCIIGQFQKAKTPIHVGPIPEPNYRYQPPLEDSIFITTCLKDELFFTEPAEDRVYGYHKGKIIDQTDNYVLCLVLFGFNVGFEYRLYSFTPTGEFISKKAIGSKISDFYEIYGFMKDKKSFELYQNEFDYKDNKPFISKKTHEKYNIQNNGVFVKE